MLCVCIVAFVGYHLWLYNFDSHFMGLTRVPATMSKCRQVWTRHMCTDEKETITAVQTLRNSLMTVTLFTVAAGYIGARAIPEILLDADYIDRLNRIQVNHLYRSAYACVFDNSIAINRVMPAFTEARPYNWCWRRD